MVFEISTLRTMRKETSKQKNSELYPQENYWTWD